MNQLADLPENISSIEPLIRFIFSKSQLETQAEKGRLNPEERELIEKIKVLLKELQNSVNRIQTNLQDWQDFDNF
ncbi:MAG: hypothetical protein ACOVQ7_23180 [Limnoraphis robusta]